MAMSVQEHRLEILEKAIRLGIHTGAAWWISRDMPLLQQAVLGFGRFVLWVYVLLMLLTVLEEMP